MSNLQVIKPNQNLIHRLVARVRWLLNRRRYRSVLFFSLHKCATTLFNGYLLRNLQYQRQVDYTAMIYGRSIEPKITFRPYGYVYGVLRLSVRPGSIVYEKLIKHVTTEEFLADKISCFLIRDPRDLLISQYFSFGFSHTYSPNPEIRSEQEKQRKYISSLSLDEYVLQIAPIMEGYFAHLSEVASMSQISEVFKYEDLVDDFDQFIKRFQRYFSLTPAVRRQLYRRSRPRTVEDITQHRRSGKTAAYKEKLQPETIVRLNEILEPALARFGYKIEG